MSDSPLKPSFFEREDPTDDAGFYAQPRLLVHIDDYAIEAARRLYAEVIPKGAAILDLMSSYRSHMPPELEWTRLAGLGMNAAEMSANDQLSDHTLHDLNADSRLPYADEEFDAAVITVSVQYLTSPVEVFRDVARVLKPGGPLIVTYSNRMFPTKAVRIWRALDDRQRAGLIGAYFRYSEAFGDVTMQDRTIDSGAYNDPLFAVWACRAGPTPLP